MNSESPEAYRSSTGIEEPVSYSSSDLPSQFVLVDKIKLQEISNQLNHLRKHDQLVIEKLVNAHSVLFSLNIVWRSFLFLFALLVGLGIFVVLYRIDIINTIVSAGITIVCLGGGLTTFVITLLTIFIYPSIFAAVTYISAAKQELVEDTIKANTIAVEMINGVMYKEGTLSKMQIAADIAYGAVKEELIANVNKMYDEMVLNTDKYLDWYYSLSAEYNRLFKLITGSIEEYMADKLKEKLMDNLTQSVNVNIAEKNIEKLKNKINKILEDNKITKKNALFDVTTEINVEDIYSLVEIEPILDVQKRFIVSTGGGLAAGAIVGTIASKVAAKTGFKTAAKAAAKAAAGKAVSAAAGVAAGVVSSIFTSPVGGAAIGTATGVAIDKGLLKLEEIVKRDEYKKEIISSIEESRQNMINMVTKAFEENNNSSDNNN